MSGLDKLYGIYKTAIFAITIVKIWQVCFFVSHLFYSFGKLREFLWQFLPAWSVSVSLSVWRGSGGLEAGKKVVHLSAADTSILECITPYIKGPFLRFSSNFHAKDGSTSPSWFRKTSFPPSFPFQNGKKMYNRSNRIHFNYQVSYAVFWKSSVNTYHCSCNYKHNSNALLRNLFLFARNTCTSFSFHRTKKR